MSARRGIGPAFAARGGIIGWVLGSMAGILYALGELRLEPTEALGGYAVGAAAGSVVGAAIGAALAAALRAHARSRAHR